MTSPVQSTVQGKRKRPYNPVINGRKVCSRCELEKPVAEFAAKKLGSGVSPYCLPCKAMISRETRVKCAAIDTPIRARSRFFRYVRKDGPIFHGSPCWIWTGHMDRELGYGRFTYKGRTIMAHRVSLILHGYDVPEREETGLVVDHLCNNRPCVNPAHLRITTQKVNTDRGNSPHGRNAAKTACSKGHPYNAENTAVVRSMGRTFAGKRRAYVHRVCLICFPQCWMYAVIERGPPPGLKPRTRWMGAQTLEAK